MYKLEYFKEDGTKIEADHHTRKAACHQAKKAGVKHAYVIHPDGTREKVRFDLLGDSITPETGHRRTYNDRLHDTGRAGKFNKRMR